MAYLHETSKRPILVNWPCDVAKRTGTIRPRRTASLLGIPFQAVSVRERRQGDGILGPICSIGQVIRDHVLYIQTGLCLRIPVGRGLWIRDVGDAYERAWLRHTR